MEALSGLLALASELNMTCIEADVFRDDLGGKRALQKLGFAKAGSGVETSHARERPEQIDIYSIALKK